MVQGQYHALFCLKQIECSERTQYIDDFHKETNDTILKRTFLLRELHHATRIVLYRKDVELDATIPRAEVS